MQPEYHAQGVAEVLLQSMEKQARDNGIQSLAVLTTRTAHWFIERGFSEASLEDLPEASRLCITTSATLRYSLNSYRLALRNGNEQALLMENVSPELNELLAKANALIQKRLKEGVAMSPGMARAGLDSLSRYTCSARQLKRVEDRTTDNEGHAVTVRLYQPFSENHKLPVMIYFHGGGHMCGSLDLYDTVCRRMANETGYLLVSVDYRLSPEHPYPAGLSDCMAVMEKLDTVLDGLPADLDRIVLSGDSAGGNLSTTVVHGLHLQGKQSITAMVLYYPSVDFTCSTNSYRTFESGYLLESRNIDWYFDHYFSKSDDRRAASPLFFTRPDKFPSSLTIAAGLDPLVDEGFLFHQRLIEAGVHSEYHLEADLIHAFLKMGQLIPNQLQVVYKRVNDFLLDVNQTTS